MVAFEFSSYYASLVIFLLAAIPGVAIGWPLLKGTKFSRLEKFLLSFFIGLFAVPTLLFLEGFVGLKFSLFLVFVNLFAIVVAGVFIGIRTGAFSIALPKIGFLDEASKDPVGFAWKLAPMVFLLIALFLAFFIRIQTFSPIYSELDPYFYVYGSGQIIKEGIVPLTDDSSWWPEVQGTHRAAPLKMYLEALWFSAYTGGGAYNNDVLYAIASWLPPISAAFMAFGAYLLVSSIFGRKYGLLVAFLIALSPIAIFKLSAGVNESSPVGFMTLFMALGVLAQAFSKDERHTAYLAAFAAFVMTSASNYIVVFAIPFAGLLVLQSLDYFARGKPLRRFLEIAAICAAGAVLASLLMAAYGARLISIDWFAKGSTAMILGGLGFAAVMYYLGTRELPAKRRWTLLAGGAVAFVVLLLITPLGNVVKTQVLDYVGSAQFGYPLQRTIAEQNEAGASFEGEGGFVALVPLAHVSASPSSWLDHTSNLMYSALNLISIPFTAIGNAMFWLMDAFFGVFVGAKIVTGNKTDSLLFVFMVITVAGLLWRHFVRKGPLREVPSVMLLVLLLTVPVMYIGVNKIKFTVFTGIMIALVAAIALAEIEAFAMWIANRFKLEDVKKYVGIAFIVLIVLVTWAQATVPSNLTMMILSKSFETRYQDDPTGLMPKLADTCEKLNKLNYYDEEICAAGYDLNYANELNSQFNSKVCVVSQLSVDELFPANNDESQRLSAEAKYGASFRCNRIGDYWIESMEWMNKNLDDLDRVTSWWDYGHWTNYLAEKKTVLRNEHASTGMIGRVAHDYILGTTQNLIDSMNYFDSRYVLFDSELIGGINGQAYGGKYGALNYLGCAHGGLTGVDQAPGTSDCEFDHSPERLVISTQIIEGNTCIISESQQRQGVYAYSLEKNGIDRSRPVYCVGDFTMPSGEKTTATYYLDRMDANGDLVLNRGFIMPINNEQGVVIAEMTYNLVPVWSGQNGTLVSGMEDAKNAFYFSNLYKGVVLGEIPGFELVFKSKNGEVKIYRMKDFVGNKEGTIDPVEAARNS